MHICERIITPGTDNNVLDDPFSKILWINKSTYRSQEV